MLRSWWRRSVDHVLWRPEHPGIICVTELPRGPTRQLTNEILILRELVSMRTADLRADHSQTLGAKRELGAALSRR